MSKNYVDIKYTIWQRVHLNDSVDINNIISMINSPDLGYENIFNEDEGFVENEILYDTEEFLSVNNNDGCSTIEVYSDDIMIWENSEMDKKIERMKKYIVEKDKTKHYKSIGGLYVCQPGSGWNILWKDNGHKLIVANVPDYYQNPEGIAQGIIKLLNEGKVILPLDI